MDVSGYSYLVLDGVPFALFYAFSLVYLQDTSFTFVE